MAGSSGLRSGRQRGLGPLVRAVAVTPFLYLGAQGSVGAAAAHRCSPEFEEGKCSISSAPELREVCSSTLGTVLLQVERRRLPPPLPLGKGPSGDWPEQPWHMPLPDDGSQISTPGPLLTLEDAIGILGGAGEMTLGQDPSSSSAMRRAAGLSSIAVVYISGRPDFNDALQEAVLRYAPMGRIFHASGKVPENFVKGLEFAVESFPNASWYYLADDDSFVVLERLSHLIGAYSADSYQYIGNRDCAGNECAEATVQCHRQAMSAGEGMPGWACGGPGVLLSAPLARAMAAERCSAHYSKDPPPVCCGDMVLACCASDVWAEYRVSPEYAFNVGMVDLDVPASAVVAVHKTDPNVTRQLGRTYNSHLPVCAKS